MVVNTHQRLVAGQGRKTDRTLSSGEFIYRTTNTSKDQVPLKYLWINENKSIQQSFVYSFNT